MDLILFPLQQSLTNEEDNIFIIIFLIIIVDNEETKFKEEVEIQ